MTGAALKQTLAALRVALDDGQLPASARATAERLINRLEKPVDVALIGLEGCGKSSLVNMLAGETIIPDGTSADWVSVLHGPPGMTATGSGADAPAQTYSAPAPLLELVTLHEFTLRGTADEMAARLRQATALASIVMWCSDTYGADEQALWALVPDAVKDHSFFVLTRADDLAARGELSDYLTMLQAVVADEFHSLFPVATLQALEALGAPGGPDHAAFAASGGKALRDTLIHEAETGRRNDIDSLQLFLHRHGIDPATQTPSAPEPALAPAPAPALADDVPVTAAPAPETALDLAPGPDRPAPLLESADADLDADAILARFRQCGAELAELADSDDPEACHAVMARCQQTAAELEALLDEHAESHPQLAPMRDGASEAAEMLVLMQLEGTDTAAADAVTLLVQLRKETCLAIAA